MAATLSALTISKSSTVKTTNGVGIDTAFAQPSIAYPGTIAGPSGPVTVVSLVVASNAAGGVDRAYSISGTVANGTPFTIDLVAGTDQYGNTLGMVHLCEVDLVNLDIVANTANILTLGGGTHAAMGSTELDTCYPQGSAFKSNPNPGWALATGTASLITVTAAAGAAVPFALLILGRSA